MPNRPQLTARQRQVYDFLVGHLQEHGFPPTVREICAEFGIKSTKGVTDHLAALERKGFIRKRPETTRWIEILDKKPILEEAVELPILGRIAAGEPALAIENAEGHLTIDRSIVPRGGSVVLRVSVDRMSGADLRARGSVCGKC